MTREDQIGVSWTEAANNGGKPVIDYRISYALDSDPDNYQVFADGITTLYTTVTGLTGGLTYLFKVEARNSVGFSALSDPVSILCARVPDAPDSFQDDTAVTSDEQIGMTWSVPFDGASEILYYRISHD